MKGNNEKISGAAKKVIVGGVSGIILGSSSMATIGNDIIEDVSSSEQNTDANYEDLSFGQAFATAREELGPGETFEWHGNTYSTNTVEEWNASHPSNPLHEESSDEIAVDISPDETGDEVQILDTVDDAEDGEIEVEIETGNDINGDEAAFIDIDDTSSDAISDVYYGEGADSVVDTIGYVNDDSPIE